MKPSQVVDPAEQRRQTRAPETPTSVYGLELKYAGTFFNRLAAVPGETRLAVTLLPPVEIDELYPLPVPASYVSSKVTHGGFPQTAFAAADGCDHLFFAPVGLYRLRDDEIEVQPRTGYDPQLAEHFLLGSVLSYWLERRAVSTFHAAAVVVDERAIAFLSSNGGGKSGLAAALMEAGYPLLTDDILPIERDHEGFRGRYGYATMRMWRDEALHFCGEFERLGHAYRGTDKRRVNVGAPDGFGAFHPYPAEIGCLYIPQRRTTEDGADVRIEPLAAAEATFILTQNTIIQRIAGIAGLQRRRFHLITDLVNQLPVRRLLYPSSFEHLPAVRAALLADIEQCAGGKA